MTSEVTEENASALEPLFRLWEQPILHRLLNPLQGAPPEVWEFRVGGYQVCEKDGPSENLIATFHKGSQTRTGEKSPAQLRAEEYCDILNQKDIGDDFLLDTEDEH